MRQDFQTWLDQCRTIDAQVSVIAQGQQKLIHHTRLVAIEKIFNDALDQVEMAFNKISLDRQRDSSLVYDDCRSIDFALVWLGRIWEFYRLKFDQRRDTENIGKLLNAADELVWSCYKQIFTNPQRLPAGVNIGPAPLPYIAAEYSPGSYEHGRPTPDELKAIGILPGLESSVSSLPVPLLRLPPWCVHNPWWLVFAAHEIGHHVQYELGLQDTFGENLFQSLLKENIHPAQAGLWRDWSKEIFADLFALVTLGPASLLGLVEIERGSNLRMLQRRKKYPAPAVRLELLRRACVRLHLPGEDALNGLDPLKLVPAGSIIDADMKQIEQVLDYSLGGIIPTRQGGSHETLETLCNLSLVKTWLSGAGMEISNWSSQLLRKPPDAPGEPTPNLTTPRLVAASSIIAWKTTNQQAGRQDRQDTLAALEVNIINTLLKSGPAGVRGEPLRVEVGAGQGAELADALLKLGREWEGE